MPTLDLNLRVRPLFRPLVQPKTRFSVAVAHRRAGKTVAAVQRLLLSALACKRERPRLAYIAPTYGQAKRVAWDYLKALGAPVMAGAANETELRIDLVNGARIQCYGAENGEALRGIYLDEAVLDEMADMPESFWPSVIRPALSDRQGNALFIGTPKGRNAFWTLYDNATRDPDWTAIMLKASETGYVAASELEMARRDMTEDQYAQEWECSFDAAVIGSYYGKVLDEAQAAGRVGSVPYDPAVRVETAWDLGVGDSTAIWFYQQVGREVRVIDYYEQTGEGLPHYAAVLDRKGYLYGRHIAPHDIAVRELGSGRSRLECGTAWNRNPVGGVIGVQTGPH